MGLGITSPGQPAREMKHANAWDRLIFLSRKIDELNALHLRITGQDPTKQAEESRGQLPSPPPLAEFLSCLAERLNEQALRIEAVTQGIHDAIF